jgi:hypothetical protein
MTDHERNDNFARMPEIPIPNIVITTPPATATQSSVSLP